EDISPDPGLNVLLSFVFGQPLEGSFEHLQVRVEGRPYGDLQAIYVEVLHDRLCIGIALLGGVPAGHEDAGHVLRAQSPGRDGSTGRGVYAAGEAYYGPRKAVLPEVVPQAENQGFEHLAFLGEWGLYPIPG